MKRLFRGLVTLGLFLGFTGQAKAEFIFTTLDVPGSTSTIANIISNSGQIAGEYADVGGNSHGFLLSGGRYTTFDVPGSTSTTANGINTSGQIVGIFQDSGSAFHGFLLSGGVYTTLDVPGSTFTRAFGINDAGLIVGSFRDASNEGALGSVTTALAVLPANRPMSSSELAEHSSDPEP
jgi:probable HAF family extracellular repeat protein